MTKSKTYFLAIALSFLITRWVFWFFMLDSIYEFRTVKGIALRLASWLVMFIISYLILSKLFVNKKGNA